MNTLRKIYHIALILISLLLFSACKKDNPIEPVNPADTASLQSFFQSLPTWDAFADNAPEQAASPTGNAGQQVSETHDVIQYNSDGSLDTLYNVTYDCQQIPYSVAKNPDQVVMYSPDKEILYPSALIQGASHKDPIGSLRGLPIAERDSIYISIPGLATGENFRFVRPNQALVDAAVGEMIGNATTDNLSTPSTITFSMESYHSEKQMALSMGLSGKYLGFSASASGSFERNQSENTVTVQLFQKMFEVVVEPPQSPSAFFSEDFTQDKLQEQVDLGRMGPTNLPVYVSNVVYGRMMMFSVTSTASEADIRASLSAAYESVGGNGASVELSAQYKNILQQSRIAITSLGGDAEATLAIIRTGDWQEYFSENPPLSTAVPLSYTFRNLGDGSIASIVETDEFSISECSENIGAPGVFNFGIAQSPSTADIAFPVQIFTGDFDGDGSEDLLYNHKSGNTNQIKIGYGSSQGQAEFQASISHPQAPIGDWGAYSTTVADLNGDGLDDIVWNDLEALDNRVSFALNQGGNQFQFFAPVESSVSGSSFFINEGAWSIMTILAGDIDGDLRDELIWTVEGTEGRRMYYATGRLNSDENALELTTPHELPGSYGYFDNHRPFIGNVNGQGQDVIFNFHGVTNKTFCLLSEPGNSFSLSDLGINRTHFLNNVTSTPRVNWNAYQVTPTQATNDSYTDMVFNKRSGSLNEIYLNTSNGDGSFSFYNAMTHPDTEEDSWQQYQQFVGDVDGDGIEDLIWAKQAAGETEAKIYVGLGTNTGLYDFSPIPQLHPYQTTWAQFTIKVMDVNGDTKKDLVWVKPGVSSELYYALAK